MTDPVPPAPLEDSGPGYAGMTQLEAEALVRARFGLDVDVAYIRACPRGRGLKPVFGIALTRKNKEAARGFEVLGAGRAPSALAAFREAWRAAEARIAVPPAVPAPPAPSPSEAP